MRFFCILCTILYIIILEHWKTRKSHVFENEEKNKKKQWWWWRRKILLCETVYCLVVRKMNMITRIGIISVWFDVGSNVCQFAVYVHSLSTYYAVTDSDNAIVTCKHSYSSITQDECKLYGLSFGEREKSFSVCSSIYFHNDDKCQFVTIYSFSSNFCIYLIIVLYVNSILALPTMIFY